MNIRNRARLSMAYLTLLSLLSSCGVDRWEEYAAQTELDQWIVEVMRENYLWYGDIPDDDQLNLFTAPQAFLKTVVSKEESNISYIDTVRNEPEPEYGFDYTLYRVANNDTAYHALVTYVLPHSPAADAGVKRGDWIMQVNDAVITQSNEKRLLDTGASLKLLLGKYTVENTPETEEQTGIVVAKGTTTIAAKAVVTDDPVHYYRVITTTQGTKVGYLVYSHFTPGTAANPELYNDRLRELSREFAAAGVTDFILDIRYNKGGSLASAELLYALLAPGNKLGTTLGSLEYNDRQTAKNSTMIFDRELLGTGENLNIRQGVVISSGATAGLSGILLNLLSPLSRWALVGSPVLCNGVATEPFINPSRTWSLNPVVCTVLNSAGESTSKSSFTPNISVNETTNLTQYLPFGDENEALLSAAISLIDGTATTTRQVVPNNFTPVRNVIHTPSRKAKEAATIAGKP